MEAVEHAIRQLSRMLSAGAPKTLLNRALTGLRSWPVRGFKEIRIYYLTEADALRIVRVLHGKREVQRILERESGEVN
jgi:toxin ParE1/3/4